mmetsp:Transcript_5481/g.8553  ORF Transcript_5481/g.8553 Transcript_5481/m.8553 type:complete len:288 (+) Transcript_5481:504-1367(+)
MHSQNIVHRDLKPENVLLEDASSPILEIKLIDFGTAKAYAQGEKLRERVGTIAYMAPEVLDDAIESYTDKCDVWSIGVIAYILLCGEMPFKEQNPKELRERIRDFNGDLDDIWNVNSFKKLDEDTQQFIRKLIAHEDDRWTSEEAFNSDWIHEVSKRLINELKEVKSDKDNTFELAKQSLISLKNFKGTTSSDQEKNPKLKEATLAIIANLLIKEKHKQTIQKVFKVMDSSGDGMLGPEEIQEGYEAIMGEQLSDEELNGIFSNVDQDGNGNIDYMDFLVASIDFSR